MTEHPSQSEQEARAEKLLYLFLEEKISEDEARELLDLWNRFPEWEQIARDNFYCERTFRFLKDRRTTLSPQRLEELKTDLRHEFDHLETGSTISVETLDLDHLVRLADASPPIEGANGRPEKPMSKVPDERQSVPISTWKPMTKRSKDFCRFLFTALTVLAVVAVYFEFRPAPSDSPVFEQEVFEPVAQVLSVADPVFPVDASIVKRDQLLGKDIVRLDAGAVRIRMNNGVELILEGPAEFKLNSPMNTFCRLGRLSVTVPPEGKGFQVVTPKLAVRDLGTEFVLDVTEDKAEAHVITGKVEVNWLTKEWFEFDENFGVKVAATIERIAADRALFVTSEWMKKRSETYENRQTKLQRDVYARWKHEPALRFRYVAGQNGPESVQGGRLVNGSRSGFQALALQSRNDRIRANVPEKLTTVTMIARVRLDSWNRTNTLFSCNEYSPKKASNRNVFFWQVDRFGRLQFLYGKNEGDRNRILSFDSPSVLKKSLCGVWVTLALVVDQTSGTVTHYLDGRQVVQLPIQESEPFALGPSSIGNDFDKRKRTDSFWGGAIESFYLFDRPFSHEEIKEFSIL